MAKWGEGDPRWIVEERPDATNVNNWHWTEKNATNWSKERLTRLFKNFEIVDDDNMVCTIENIEKCSGEATANNRKGKLIFFYEWDLVFKWKGSFKTESSVYSGKVSIPNLSEENDLDDIEITITIDESNNNSETLKQFMYNVGREKIRKVLGDYIVELKEEYSKNLILPIKNTLSEKKICSNQFYAKEERTSEITSIPSPGCKIDERSIFIEEDFKCTGKDLFDVLTIQSMVETFTRGSASVDAQPGGHFDLYGGHVHGYFEKLIPEKLITLKWRLKSWPTSHYSKVVIELEEMKNCTLMKLNQSGVPASEYDVVKANWYRYYWHSIKQSFGYGISLTGVF